MPLFKKASSLILFINIDPLNLIDEKIFFEGKKVILVPDSFDFPDTFKGVWEKGLNNQKYFLKLCGSGGGGFLLGFAPDFEAAKEELKEYDLKIVQRI